jgi:hypothetical protein
MENKYDIILKKIAEEKKCLDSQISEHTFAKFRLSQKEKQERIKEVEKSRCKLSNITSMLYHQNSNYQIYNNIKYNYQTLVGVCRECFLKESPELFLDSQEDLTLSDFDINLFKINKSNRTVTYNDVSIPIIDIQSSCIRQWCINQNPELFLHPILNDEWSSCIEDFCNLELSNFDTTKFIFNKEKQTLTYNDVTISISEIIFVEIRVYCMKQMPEYFLTDDYAYDFKLTDVDRTLFKINKPNQSLRYNDVTINIKDIQSEEIKKYCLDELQRGEDKDICKYIIDTIQKNSIITINLKLYNSLKSSQNKLYILKYVFSKYRDLTELANKEELFKIFLDYPSFVIDLLRQMISTNNKNLEYILKNKVISIDRNEYKKLQDYSTQLHLFELTNILTIYESLDYMLNDKVVIVNSNSGELWD